MLMSPETVKQDFHETKYFIDCFGVEQIIKYSPTIVKMSEIIKKQLHSIISFPENESIANISNYLTEEQKTYDLNFGINKISEFLYDTSPEVFDLYHKFLKEELREWFKTDFYYQVQPTIRLQTPHKSAHIFYPHFHSDMQTGHPPYETNVWIPLSEPCKQEGHGFSVSTIEESKEIFHFYGYDIKKMNNNKPELTKILSKTAKLQDMPVGNVLLFDARHFHSTIPLNNHSRLSMDIRIVPKNIINTVKKFYTGTGRRAIKFMPNHAYSSKTIDSL